MAFVQEKRGPLPIWAWAGLVLVLVLVFVYWRRGKAKGDAIEYSTGDPSALDNQAAPPIFIVPQATPPAVNVGPVNVTATVPAAPPGGGSGPPTTPPATPAPPQIKAEKVTVSKYTSKNPPWSSTLSGIYAHFKGKTTATSWQAIWNHPLNASLKTKRGDATRIQPGDTIFVPVR